MSKNSQHIKNLPINLFRNNFLNINCSFESLGPEKFPFRQRILPPIPDIFQKLYLHIPRGWVALTSSKMLFNTGALGPVFLKTFAVHHSCFPRVLVNTLTCDGVDSRVFTVYVGVDEILFL